MVHRIINVMHVIDSLARGGAERMLVEIANNTSIENYNVSVCITRSRCDLANELKQNIPIYILNRSSKFDLHGFQKFRALVNKQRVNILHVHGRSTFSFIALLKTMGLINTPVILHDHFGMIEKDDTIPLWFRLWGKGKVSHYVGVCQKLVSWAKKAGVSSEKTLLIENAIDLMRISKAKSLDIRNELGLSRDSQIGIFVGGIRPEKGLDVLVKAAGQMRPLQHIVFLIVGAVRDPDYLRLCRKQIAQLNLQDVFIFLGERKDVPRILKGVDFAVLPSVSESGPLVLIEFMASGLPFVAAEVGNVSQMVKELGVPGFVSPEEPQTFAQELARLLSLSREERLQQGKFGQEVAFKELDINKKMDQWHSLYSVISQEVARK